MRSDILQGFGLCDKEENQRNLQPERRQTQTPVRGKQAAYILHASKMNVWFRLSEALLLAWGKVYAPKGKGFGGEEKEEKEEEDEEKMARKTSLHARWLIQLYHARLRQGNHYFGLGMSCSQKGGGMAKEMLQFLGLAMARYVAAGRTLLTRESHSLWFAISSSTVQMDLGLDQALLDLGAVAATATAKEEEEKEEEKEEEERAKKDRSEQGGYSHVGWFMDNGVVELCCVYLQLSRVLTALLSSETPPQTTSTQFLLQQQQEVRETHTQAAANSPPLPPLWGWSSVEKWVQRVLYLVQLCVGMTMSEGVNRLRKRQAWLAQGHDGLDDVIQYVCAVRVWSCTITNKKMKLESLQSQQHT